MIAKIELVEMVLALRMHGISCGAIARYGQAKGRPVTREGVKNITKYRSNHPREPITESIKELYDVFVTNNNLKSVSIKEGNCKDLVEHDPYKLGRNNWFYVYQLIDPRDGQIFYVGKGRGERLYAHEKDARKGIPGAKCDKIREIIDAGLEIDKRIVALFADEQKALEFECQLMRDIGLQLLQTIKLPSHTS